MTGTADGMRVRLDGGGELVTMSYATGPVAATFHPSDVAVDVRGALPTGSASNHVAARVMTVTEIGSRVRVGLQAGQPLVAEITAKSRARLDLVPGDEVTAVVRATAISVVAR